MKNTNDSGPWLGEDGPDADIVLSSRVRLARNLAGVPFVNRATDADRNEVVGIVRRTPLFAQNGGSLNWVEMEDIVDRDQRLLVERHLISSQFAEATFPRGVALSKDEFLSVMVNEEDHLRIQTLESGFALREAHERVTQLNSEFESSLDFAFSPRWGFLTACPTNVGCGVRFSVMLHLPALRMTDELNRVRRAAKDLHLAVRGFHGEGTESTGDFFQVSNQVTLGVSEEDLLEEFCEEVVPRLVEYERTSRKLLMERRRTTLEDRVHRALAILSSARLLDADEAIMLLSRIRIGQSLELIDVPSMKDIHRLLLHVQPAHLSSMTGLSLDDFDGARAARATLVRRTLGTE
jgi:protein arginine kinase